MGSIRLQVSVFFLELFTTVINESANQHRRERGFNSGWTLFCCVDETHVQVFLWFSIYNGDDLKLTRCNEIKDKLPPFKSHLFHFRLVVKPRFPVSLLTFMSSQALISAHLSWSFEPLGGGGGVSEMCAKRSGVCRSVMAGVKGENRACRMGSDLFVQMVSWGLKHTSCV